MTEIKRLSPRSYQGVMISGTFEDLQKHREVLTKALTKEELFPIQMESYIPTHGDSLISSSLGMVQKASAYIDLIGHRYGQVDGSPELNPNGWSISRQEFEEAQKLALPTVIFIMGPLHPVREQDVEVDPSKREKLREFRERAKEGRIYIEFDNLADFTEKAIHAVAGLRRALELPYRLIPTPPNFYPVPPYLGSHRFVGRRVELDRLSHWASPTDIHPILLFEAIGGTGKSLLTWEWITKHAPTLRTDWAGRFWYSFYQQGANLSTFCRHALAYITGEPLDARNTISTEFGERLLYHLQKRPWLLVLDGLERLLLAYHRIDAAQVADEEAEINPSSSYHHPHSTINPEDEDFLRSLATSSQSKILITTRLRPRALINSARQVLPKVLHLPLGGLRPLDAEEMFRSCGIRGESKRIQDYLQEHCDCHPLFIGVLAGLVNEYMPDRGNFDAWESAVEGSGQLDLADLNLVQKRNHILAIALSSLQESSYELLSILALLSEAVDYQTLNALNSHLPPQRLAAAITDLEERGLIQYDAQARRYDLHPVVRSVVAGRLPSEEAENYGWRVVDHFSQRTIVSYEEVQTIEDLRPRLQVVQTLLWMGRLDDAYNAFHGALANALGFGLESHAELLALLKPFFPRGWDRPPEGLGPREASYLASWAAFALQKFGNFPEALSAYGLSLETGLAEADWWHTSSELWNISSLFYNRNRLAVSERCEIQALSIASLREDPEALFIARLNLFRTLSERGEAVEAERLWLLLEPMGRAWALSSYRPGEAERQLALSKFWRETLSANDLDQAERLTRDGKNRYGLRALHSLSGEWHFGRKEWQAAADCLREAVRMAHEAIQDDAKSETLLALAKFQLDQLAEPRIEVERLSQMKNCFDRGLAELWLTIGDRASALVCALAAYKWSWADGEPYVHRYELNKSRELLERLGVEIPNLPPYDPVKDEKLPWEDEVAAAIERLRAEKAAAGQPRVEG